jgi:hypothetical protein
VDDEHGMDNPDPKVNDDTPLTEYGHPASTVEKRNIAVLVKRYYEAAVAQDGVKACSLLYWRLARNPGLKRTVPEDQYTVPIRVRVSPGESCAHVTSLLFKLHHHGLMMETPTLQVTAVRVDGTHGVAMLGFNTASEQWIPVAREGAVWKIHALLATLLP